MGKVQDLFKSADGGKILDTPFTMRIEQLPTEPKTIEKDGKTINIFDVKLSHQGQVLEWGLSAEQVSRIFANTDKGTGAVTWEAKVGDIVNVSYMSNQSNPTRPYYKAQPAQPDDNFVTQVNVSEGNKAPVSARKSSFGKPTTEWDGTPRQGNFRAGIACHLDAILANPQINPKDPEDVEFAKKLAVELLHFVRSEGAAQEADNKEPDVA